MSTTRTPLAGLTVALALLSGCRSEPAPAPAPLSELPPRTSPAAASSDRMRWKDAGERILLEIGAKSEGEYRIYDPDDAPLGEIRVQEDRVKLKDAQDVEVRKVKRKQDGGAEIEDAAGERLFRIELDPDGTYKLRDAADVTLVKAKPKDDGYEVRDAAGATLAKVKVRVGKLSFETEAGQDLGELKGVTDARAGMWLAAEPLSLPERAALVVYFLEVERR
jgi:hypothetical protein